MTCSTGSRAAVGASSPTPPALPTNGPLRAFPAPPSLQPSLPRPFGEYPTLPVFESCAMCSVKVFGALFASGSALGDGLAHPAPGKVCLPALCAVRRRQALRSLSYPNFVRVDSGQPLSLMEEPACSTPSLSLNPGRPSRPKSRQATVHFSFLPVQSLHASRNGDQAQNRRPQILPPRTQETRRKGRLTAFPRAQSDLRYARRRPRQARPAPPHPYGDPGGARQELL